MASNARISGATSDSGRSGGVRFTDVCCLNHAHRTTPPTPFRPIRRTTVPLRRCRDGCRPGRRHDHRPDRCANSVATRQARTDDDIHRLRGARGCSAERVERRRLRLVGSLSADGEQVAQGAWRRTHHSGDQRTVERRLHGGPASRDAHRAGSDVPRPNRLEKIRQSKLGKPRPKHVADALRVATLGTTWSAEKRHPRSYAPWTADEDTLVRTLSIRKVVKLTGRSKRVVVERRAELVMK